MKDKNQEQIAQDQAQPTPKKAPALDLTDFSGQDLELAIESKPVPGFPNYVCFPDGRVYIVKKKRFVKQRELPPGSGYMAMVLSNDGRAEQVYVNRLVAKIFVKNPRPDEYDKVIPNDGNKSNSHRSNLMWGTMSMAHEMGETGDHYRVKREKRQALEDKRKSRLEEKQKAA